MIIIIQFNKIYNQDCREGMENLIQQGYTKHFDFIEIDPPYNIGKDKWDKFKSHEEYLKFIEDVVDLSSQLMSDNGTLFIWHSEFDSLCDIRNIIKNNTTFNLRNFIVWNKYFKYNDDASISKYYGFFRRYAFGSGLKSYPRCEEYLLYYTKQSIDDGREQFILNCKQEITKYIRCEILKSGLTQNQIREKMGLSMKGGGQFGHWIGQKQPSLITKDNYEKMQNVLQSVNPKLLNKSYTELIESYKSNINKYSDIRYTFNNKRNNSCMWNYNISKITGHKTEKPLQLYYDMFEVHTRKDSKCLFPFVGSGNNIISLLNINKDDNGCRDFIGFDTDEKWIQLTNNRINKLLNI